ncbi:MAG TPA: Nif11-like leader peptide family natural product precursor [Aggregatilineales bacterium]|nr:Nif11-like leader peptide family natural product precursor [Aggregatilineales bacterium]
MSQAQVEAFVRKVNGDTKLQDQVKSLTPGDADGLLKIASAAGFQFTIDELRTVVRPYSGEMSDQELGNVAGGSAPNVEPIYMQYPLQHIQSSPILPILVGL